MTLLKDAVAAQTALLIDEKPLDAFDAYFGTSVQMFANDVLFAAGAEEGRRKQEPFIAATVAVTGAVTDIKVMEDENMCVFRNKSRFTTADGAEHQIDGLCWQRWQDGRVVEERYYDGDLMRQLIVDGLLENPAILLGSDRLLS